VVHGLAAGLTAGLGLTGADVFTFVSFGAGGLLHPARITIKRNIPFLNIMDVYF
jgi:hypothetical protein